MDHGIHSTHVKPHAPTGRQPTTCGSLPSVLHAAHAAHAVHAADADAADFHVSAYRYAADAADVTADVTDPVLTKY